MNIKVQIQYRQGWRTSTNQTIRTQIGNTRTNKKPESARHGGRISPALITLQSKVTVIFTQSRFTHRSLTHDVPRSASRSYQCRGFTRTENQHPFFITYTVVHSASVTLWGKCWWHHRTCSNVINQSGLSGFCGIQKELKGWPNQRVDRYNPSCSIF
jgi:hypothetical protein